ncbi:hypothetical protein [Helicobacter vulpis]|nr:hypothetical protein [Helicobacter vulpis]
MNLSLKAKQYIHALLFIVTLNVDYVFVSHFSKIRHWLWWEQ